SLLSLRRARGAEGPAPARHRPNIQVRGSAAGGQGLKGPEPQQALERVGGGWEGLKGPCSPKSEVRRACRGAAVPAAGQEQGPPPWAGRDGGPGRGRWAGRAAPAVRDGPPRPRRAR